MKITNGTTSNHDSIDDKFTAIRASVEDLVDHVVTRVSELRDATIGERRSKASQAASRVFGLVRRHPIATAGIALGVAGVTYLAIQLIARRD